MENKPFYADVVKDITIGHRRFDDKVDFVFREQYGNFGERMSQSEVDKARKFIRDVLESGLDYDLKR